GVERVKPRMNTDKRGWALANPKSETRNSKQIRISKSEILKTRVSRFPDARFEIIRQRVRRRPLDGHLWHRGSWRPVPPEAGQPAFGKSLETFFSRTKDF